MSQLVLYSIVSVVTGECPLMSGKVQIAESGFFSGFPAVWLKEIVYSEGLGVFSIREAVKMWAYDCNSKWHR